MSKEENLVVAGAIWSRTDAKSQGRQSTILLVANRHLKGQLAEKFPPMVTYKDDRGNINTVSEERFTSNREYWDMDDAIVYQVQTLLNIEPEQESSEDEDEDGLTVVDDDGLSDSPAQQSTSTPYVTGVMRPATVSFDDDEETEGDAVPQTAEITAAVVDPEPTLEDVQQLQHPELVAVFISNNATYPELEPELIEQSVVQYEQEPVLTEEGLGLRHKVLVFMNQGLDMDILNAAFDPAKANYYSSFKINNLVINWDSYLGAWPVVSTDGVYASLVFTTNPIGTVETESEAAIIQPEEQPTAVEQHLSAPVESTEEIIEKLNTSTPSVFEPASQTPLEGLAQTPAQIVNMTDDALAFRAASVAQATQQAQPVTLTVVSNQAVTPPINLVD